MIHMKLWLLLFLAAMLVLGSPALTRADGFILPDHPDIHLRQSYRIDFHQVEIEINNGVAEVRVDQAFTNLLNTPLEVTYLFPIPAEAAIDRFSLVVDGKEIMAELYDRDEARRIYEKIVRERRDPALLEYAGKGLFRTSVFPIPAHGTRRVKLSYRQVVAAQGDLRSLIYPLGTEKYSAEPLDRVEVKVTINAKEMINNLYSPSHPLTILSRSEHKIVAKYAAANVLPRADLRLFYQLAEPADFQATVLTYRSERGEDGYFMLLASPRAELPAAAVQPKTILFVLDRSGSMSGQKLSQAKAALRTILPNLNAKDRFNLIIYNDKVENFKSLPCAAGKREIEQALSFVDEINALGSTDIDRALRAALDQCAKEEKERGKYVIFLTDGQPTAGEISFPRIREKVKAANTMQARVFVFGLGFDVNTDLLDGLAVDNRGLAGYIKPDEDLETAVAGLYRQIQNPVLTDLKLSCDGVTMTDILPSEMPDLFYGQQLVLTGRYHGHGGATITLSGLAAGKKRSFSYREDFPAGEDRLEMAFVARLWAQRKIGYLLDQLRQLSPDSASRQELIDEIVRLAKTFGIATEYTSFLVLEEDNAQAADMLYKAAAAPATGAGAVGSAQATKSLQNASQEAQADWSGGRMQTVGAKTFYLRDGIWTDSAYKQDDKPIKITAFAKEYFDLAARLGDKAIYLSFAERIILVWEDKAYLIQPEE